MSAAAIERLALFFSAEQTRQGVLARAALGRPGAGDGEIACGLARRLGDELRADGSLCGGGLPTIWRVHELLDLGPSADVGEPARRALNWVLQLQGRPGAYGEGCDRERHARGLCAHHLTGFFAPGPPTERITPVTLPNGKVYRAEPAARFAISGLALRAVLRGGLGDRPSVRRHVDALAAVTEQWTTWGGYFPPDLIVVVMHALAAAGAERREVVRRLAGLAAASQQDDGGWPNTDFFHALEGLRAAGTEEARSAIRRAVPALVARQRPDGTFGPMAQQERALIALRALLWVQD
ncbi:MAG TPA: hypothetical protein VEB59_10810 [Gemmatimonadales bacterium]|nr:hypothetical protein [Gemmatimonadales bacterium]